MFNSRRQNHNVTNNNWKYHMNLKSWKASSEMNSSAVMRVHIFTITKRTHWLKKKSMSQMSWDFRICDPFVMVTVNLMLYKAYFSHSSPKVCWSSFGKDQYPSYEFNLVWTILSSYIEEKDMLRLKCILKG